MTHARDPIPSQVLCSTLLCRCHGRVQSYRNLSFGTTAGEFGHGRASTSLGSSGPQWMPPMKSQRRGVRGPGIPPFTYISRTFHGSPWDCHICLYIDPQNQPPQLIGSPRAVPCVVSGYWVGASNHWIGIVGPACRSNPQVRIEGVGVT